MTQEVAYNSLLVKRRKEIHEKIGRALERLHSERLEDYCELLAYHYVRSDNREKALEYLRLAHLKTSKATAMEEAKSYFDQCMDLLDRMPDTEKNREHRISLLVNSYIVFFLLLRIREYYELLTRYEHLTGKLENPSLAGRFYDSLGYCEWYSGSYDSAIQRCMRGAELCELGGDVGGAGRALCVLQVVHLWKGDLDRAVGLREEVARRLCDKLDDLFNLRRMVTSLFYTSLAYIWLGRWNEAADSGKEALRLAQEYSDDSLISLAGRSLCLVYTFKGDLNRAIAYGENAVEKAQTFLDRTQSELFLAYAKCRAGIWEGNIGRLAEIVQLAGDTVPGSLRMAYVPFLAEAYILAGQHDKVGQTVQEALELAERHGARYFLGWAHRLLGEIALKTGAGEARPHFEQAISVFSEIKAENELALAYSGMGRYHKQQGTVEEARKYLADALKIFERLGTLIEPDKVRKELAELPV